MNKAECEVVNGKGSYDLIHVNLRNQNPKADHCVSCDGSKAKRFEYALIKGRTYSLNIKDYQQMCPSCHRKYDMTDKQRAINKINGKKGVSKPHLNKSIIDDNGNIYTSTTEASLCTGISKTAICNCLTGRSKTAGNLKWEYNE